MNVLLFGATGMIGQGVLRACLDSPDVTRVVAVGRSAVGVLHAKLVERVVADVADPASYEDGLDGVDACFFCLGVSSAGMSEPEYTRLTHDLTLAVARALVRRSPGATFAYVSGVGTDSTERGRSMWARVKGRTETAILALPFRRAYMFRPGFVEALAGTRSRTPLYRILYAVIRPVAPLLRRRFPNQVTSALEIGRAMIATARDGWPRAGLEPPDINAAAAS